MSNKRVVLKPFDLIIFRYNTYSGIYAGLWEITSSDMETHLEFCRFMYQRGVFGFSNVGEVVNEGEPYTFDDGLNSLNWLGCLFRALHDVAACKGINVVIELDRKLNQSYNVSEINEDKTFKGVTGQKLIDTYFKSLISFASYMKAPNFVRTRITKFDNYNYNMSNDKILVDFRY